MGDVSARVPLPGVLLRYGVIAPLPALDAAELYAACEILIQEDVRVWTLPWPATGVLRALREMFDGRAIVGVRGRVAPSELAAVREAGGAFVAQALARPEVIARATDLGLPTLAGALTPAEVERAAGLDASAVQLVPADHLDPDYADLLGNEVPGVPLVVTGRVDSAAAGRWFERGAVAVCPTSQLIGNALSGGVLMGLRVRSRDYSAAFARVRSTARDGEGLRVVDSEDKLRNS